MVDVGDVTPVMAATWLGFNRNNRNIHKATVKKYERIIREGQWRTTHQGIAFYTTGDIADGQHRLQAIVNTGITIKMMVVVGINIEDAFAIDNGKLRCAHDRLSISHLSAIRKSSLPVIYEYISKANITDSDTKLIGEYFKEDLEFVFKNFRLNSVKKITNSAVSSVIVLAHHDLKSDEDKNKLRRFCEVLTSNTDETAIDAYPVLKLRDFLLSNPRTKKNNILIKGQTQRAIYQFMNGVAPKNEAIPRYVYPKDAPLYSNVVVQ